MDFGERAVEASTAFDDAERDRAIQRVRQSIAMQGDPDCAECGDPIEEKRRAAMPSATRCIGCQSAYERALRR
ncbi:TraR/DksA C4-type zinc finger protein [Erythrobacter sp. A30-3]|nr:TraR/DksA C4-type zinc finger protein [Erythrobacter sp. A30-3]